MKGNKVVRLMAIMVLLPMIIAHLLGQVDMLTPSWLWVTAFAGLMGLQATYTGFCPGSLIAKFSKDGQCCESGSCSTSQPAKKEPAKSSCCGDSAKPQASGSCSDTPKKESDCCADDSDCCNGAVEKAELYQVKVLGTGCANCNNTYQQIEKVANQQSLKIELQKVEDIAEIAKYGVMTTPAVVVNEKVVHSGGVPTAKMVEAWFK